MKKLFLFGCLAATLSVQAQPEFTTRESLDINRLKPGHMVHGDMWWDPTTGNADCRFPKNSTKNVTFLGALWIGGYDAQHNLHQSAQTYRQDGNDYWPGPITNGAQTPYATSRDWAKIWKVNKTTVDSFRQLSSHTLVNTPAVVLEWPAKGNTYAKGNNSAPLTITKDMAPYMDVNGDGHYNALDGDYPQMKGDQMLWWVINDYGTTHSQCTDSSYSLKMEIQNTAYAYNRPGVYGTTVFYEYLLHNYGSTLDSFVLALFSDADLGYAFDDYVGFDSTRRMGVSYNARTVDGTGQANAYGNKPPMAGYVMLQSPGDSAARRAPAGYFGTFNNNSSNSGNPYLPQHFYNYMTGRQKDGTPTGYKYYYAGDPGNPTQPSECASSNAPDDRRFVMATTPTPYRLAAGAVTRFAFALIVQDSAGGCPTTGFTTLNHMADTVINNYPQGPSTAVAPPVLSAGPIGLHPNPARTELFLDGRFDAGESVQLFFYDAMGRTLRCPYRNDNGRLTADVRALPPGIYFVRLQRGDKIYSDKFIRE